MKELINLLDITTVHKILIELDSYIEDPDTGEPHDSYFQRLENVFYLAFDKSTEALRALREFTELAADSLQGQARKHLSNNNDEIREQKYRMREETKEHEKWLNS